MNDTTTDTLRTSMRHIVDMTPSAPDLPTVPERRDALRPVMALASGFAAVILMVGVGAVVLVQSNNPESASPSGAASTETEPVESVTATTKAPVEQPTGFESWVPLGLTLQGWDPVTAYHNAPGSAVHYSTEASDPAATDIGRVAITIWPDLPGSEAGSGYEHAPTTLDKQGADPLGDVTLFDGGTATAYAFSDPNTGHGGFAFVWSASPRVSVEVLAYVDTFAEATKIVESIEPLSDFEWNTILDEVGEPDQPTVSTTTSIAPQG